MTVISIHAAREGGDCYGAAEFRDGGISIHAAREGGDFEGEKNYEHDLHFNPRRP